MFRKLIAVNRQPISQKEWAFGGELNNVIKMKTKFSTTHLYVVCNIFGDYYPLFDVYTDDAEASNYADMSNKRHEDANTKYEILPLNYYLMASDNEMTLLDAFNEYHRD